MKRNVQSPRLTASFLRLSLASLALLCSAAGTAAPQQAAPAQCPATDRIAAYAPPSPIVGMQQGSIGVRADHATVEQVGNKANFWGDVEVQNQQLWLFTDQATINQATGRIEARGNVRFSDGFVNVTGEGFSLDGQNNQVELRQTRYQMATTNATGVAETLKIDQQSVNLLGSTFTTCPAEDPAWQLSAERIAVSENEDFGEAWNAKFELFDVPVFYIPYFTFPVNDKRKTGLLYPTIDSSSTSGLEVSLPYYFNIAANMDATLTPSILTNRGAMIAGEYRYLFERQQGQVNLEFLGSDNSIETRPDRYLWHVNHSAKFSDRLSGYLNATGISDDDYINDFGSEFAGRADTSIYRVAQLDYQYHDWHAQLRSEDYELLGQFNPAFRTMPQISLDYQPFQLENGLNARWESELTYFQNQQRGDEHALRLHLQPSLALAYEDPAFEGLAEASMLYTRYEQRSPNEQLAESTGRTLPRLRLRGQVNFERIYESDGENFRQTLSPQIQYLYVPFRDQSDIGIYDTTLMQDDYNGLFRARRFSGLDRVAEANQVTVGASTQLFDASEHELMRLSIGQIYYLENSRTGLLDDSAEITSSNSEVAGDLAFQVGRRWSFSSAIQYDTELNVTRKSQTALEYRKDDQHLIQLSHRNVSDVFTTDIEQVGMQTVWSLGSRWQVAANVYYDLSNDRTNDAILGLQYQSCCWALRFSAYRRINRNLEFVQNSAQPFGQPEFDNGISLQFIITGLTGDSNSLIDMLQKSIYGYRRPFYLSN